MFRSGLLNTDTDLWMSTVLELRMRR